MTEEDMDKVIHHQCLLELKEKPYNKGDLSDKEWLELKYKMAIKMLIEL